MEIKVCLWLFLPILIFISSCNINKEQKIDIFNPSSIEDCRSLVEGEEFSDFSLITDKSICLANYGKIAYNYSECNEEEKPFCLGGFASKSNDATVCEDEICFLAIGLSSDLNTCEIISYDEKSARFIDFEKRARDICKLGAAVTRKDINICRTFKNEDYLKYYCSINVAKQTKNVNICESLDEGMAQECFFIIAIEKNDKFLCKKVIERKQECEDIIVNKRATKEKNPLKCLQLDDYYEAAECVTAIAVEKADEKLCEHLESGFGKVLEECYAKVAISKNNITLCESSIGSSLDNNCYSTILAKNSNPIELCKKLNNTSFIYCVKNIDCGLSKDKEGCTKFISTALDNPDLCKYELDYSAETSCYIRLAIKFDSLTICLRDKFNRKHCVTEFALATNNSEACKLADESCYRAFAEKYDNVSYCFEANSDECFYSFAVNKKDPQICAEIASDDRRGDCYRYLALQFNNISLCEYAEYSRDLCINRIKNQEKS